MSGLREVGQAYAGCRRRMVALVEDVDAAAEGTVVPSCPAWTVHDLVAHVAGVVDDALAGRVEGAGSDEWTAAQVEAGRERPLRALVEQWAAAAPALEAVLDDLGRPGRQAVFDVVTHEHDLRAALGRPGARDSDGVAVGLTFVGWAITAAAEERGIGLRVTADDGSSWGPDDAEAVVSASAFELLRALSGRRSLDQLRALRWEGDRERALDAFTFGPFRPSERPVVE
jgi:uncharacterized protein (TIGR03083 family)